MISICLSVGCVVHVSSPVRALGMVVMEWVQCHVGPAFLLHIQGIHAVLPRRKGPADAV